MKRLFTFLFSLTALTLCATAQDINQSFQFVDKSGTVVPDGSTVVASDYDPDEDGFGEGFISTGLYVKNTTGSSDYIRVRYDITRLDGGDFQICFPVNCVRQAEAGEYVTTAGTMSASTPVDLQCEWFPPADEYGRCQATLQIEIVERTGLGNNQFAKKADGPTVTVTFVYDDPAGIARPTQEMSQAQGFYDLQGRRLDAPGKGVTIVRQSNGTTIKQISK